MSVSSVAIQFTLIDLLSKGVDRIRSRMAALAKGNQQVQTSFDRMARSAKFAAVSGLATREIYRGLKPAIRAAGQLQAEMLGTRAEMAGSVRDAAELEARLKRIAGTAFGVQAWTPFDQGQIVALEKQLLKAGAEVGEVVGRTGAAAAAAALATYEDLDPVTMGRNLIGIGTPFKIQADQYMRLADRISRAASASTVGAAELAETAKYAAPAMAQLNRSMDEMLVLSAMMAKRGIDASMAGTGLRQFYNAAAGHKVFRDAAGNLKPLAEITAVLRKSLAGLGEAEQLEALTDVFDVRGAPVALALMEQGKDTYEATLADMEASLSLDEKIRISMLGLNAQWRALKGTSRSTLAGLYQPALAPLTTLVRGMNALVGAIGRAVQGSETLGKAVSGISLGGVGAGSLATVGLGAGALYYGRRLLKSTGGLKGLLSGLGGAAAGIATGKAVEAATGVRPVFVTNWPANLGGLSAGAAAGGSKGKGSGSWWKNLPLLGRLGAAGAATYALHEYSLEPLGLGFSGLKKNWKGYQDAYRHMAEVLTGKRHWHTGELLQQSADGGPDNGDGLVDAGRMDAGGGLGRFAPEDWEALIRELGPSGSEDKRAIEINMQIDEQRRVTAVSDDMQTQVNTRLRRGVFE